MKTGLDNEYVKYLMEQQGFEVYPMEKLPTVMSKFSPWEFLGMCQRGGDVDGARIYDNTNHWKFDCPVDPEQSFLFIVPSDKGKILVSGTEWDAQSIVNDMMLSEEFDEWEEEYECSKIL